MTIYSDGLTTIAYRIMEQKWAVGRQPVEARLPFTYHHLGHHWAKNASLLGKRGFVDEHSQLLNTATAPPANVPGLLLLLSTFLFQSSISATALTKICLNTSFSLPCLHTSILPDRSSPCSTTVTTVFSARSAHLRSACRESPWVRLQKRRPILPAVGSKLSL